MPSSTPFQMISCTFDYVIRILGRTRCALCDQLSGHKRMFGLTSMSFGSIASLDCGLRQRRLPQYPAGPQPVAPTRRMRPGPCGWRAVGFAASRAGYRQRFQPGTRRFTPPAPGAPGPPQPQHACHQPQKQSTTDKPAKQKSLTSPYGQLRMASPEMTNAGPDANVWSNAPTGLLPPPQSSSSLQLFCHTTIFGDLPVVLRHPCFALWQPWCKAMSNSVLSRFHGRRKPIYPS